MIDWNNFREKFVKFIIIIFIILIVYLTLNIIFIVDFLFGLSFIVIGILIGWVLKSYFNCGVPYFAWHKGGIQIDEGDVNEIDEIRDWKMEGAESSSNPKVQE